MSRAYAAFTETGLALAETLARSGIATRWIRLCNTGDTFAPQGAVSRIYEYYHLDGNGIAATCLEAMQHEKETGRPSV